MIDRLAAEFPHGWALEFVMHNDIGIGDSLTVALYEKKLTTKRENNL